MLVVSKLEQIERGDAAVGSIASDHIYFVSRQSRVSEIERHVAYAGEIQPVHARETRIAIRPHHKIMPKSGLPMRRIPGCIRNRFEIKPARIFATHQDREGIVETERLADPKI